MDTIERKQTVVALRHLGFMDLGIAEDLLRHRNFEIKYLNAVTDDMDQSAVDADLLVLLGGTPAAYQTIEFQFLAREAVLVERRLTRSQPTLGIGLGSQIMAAALGARVYQGHRKEVGWFPITATPEGARHPVGDLAAENGVVLHWHEDTFDLPKGATRLASSDLCENQAFSYGRAAVALQFHFEVTQRAFENWLVGYVHTLNRGQALDIGELREQCALHAAAMNRRGRAMLDSWLDGLGLE